MAKNQHVSKTGNVYVVRPDGTPDDNYVDTDTVSGIATEWLHQNPKQTQFTGTYKERQLAVQQEIVKLNGLKNKDGIECDVHKDGPLIHVGQPLDLPEGNKVVNPPQHKVKCPTVKPVLEQPTPPVKAPVVPVVVPVVVPPAPVREVSLAGARLPLEPKAGNLSAGQTAQTYTLIDSLYQLDVRNAMKPKTPHIAARGQTDEGIGVQTSSDLARSPLSILPWTPFTGSSANYHWGVMFPGLNMSTRQSANSYMQSREGGNGSNQDGVTIGDTVQINMLPLSSAGIFRAVERTNTDAIYLKHNGIQVNEKGEPVDVAGDRYNNNPYYAIVGDGASKFNITSNESFQKTGEHNWFMQSTPSGPVPLQLNNYSYAAIVDQINITPRIETVGQDVAANPTKENVQELVGLYNLRANLTGISNYPVNADISKKLDDETVTHLNISERIAYDRNRLVEWAHEKGIDGIDTQAVGKLQGLSREQMRANEIEVWTDIAKNKTRAFEEVYAYENKKDAKFDASKDEDLRRVATEHVDNMPYLKTYAEKGYDLTPVVGDFALSPREKFNKVEKFEYLPTKEPNGSASLKGAMDAIAGNPDNIRAVLAAAGTDQRVADAIVMRDTYSIQMPRWHGDREFKLTRGDVIDAVEKRGYSKEMMESQFTSNESYGIIRQPAQLGREIAASAKDDAVVALRAEDLRTMVKDGVQGSTIIGESGHAKQLLHALAAEPGNKTLLQIEDNIRKTAASPEAAQAQIEALRQGVTYAKDNVSLQHTERSTHTEIGREVALQSMISSPKDAATLNLPVFEIGAMATAVQTPDAKARDIATASAYLTETSTGARGLNAINQTAPGFITAASVKTLLDHPELQQPVLDHLRSMARGNFLERGMGRTPQQFLAYDLEDLFAAQKAGDTAGVERASSKIDAFVKSGRGNGPADPFTTIENAQATSDLFTAMVVTSTPAGTAISSNAALTQTVVNTVQAAGQGAATPLPGYDMPAQQTLDTVYGAIAKADPTNATGLASHAVNVLKNQYTVDGYTLNVIAAAVHRHHPQQQPTPSPQPAPTPTPTGTVPGCGEKGPACPVAPTPVAPVPVAPTPVAPAPVPVAPTPVAPAPVPVAPTPVAPAPVPVAPTPVAPVPVAPAPVPVAPVPVPVPAPVPVPVPSPVPVPVPAPTPIITLPPIDTPMPPIVPSNPTIPIGGVSQCGKFSQPVCAVVPGSTGNSAAARIVSDANIKLDGVSVTADAGPSAAGDVKSAVAGLKNEVTHTADAKLGGAPLVPTNTVKPDSVGLA